MGTKQYRWNGHGTVHSGWNMKQCYIIGNNALLFGQRTMRYSLTAWDTLWLGHGILHYGWGMELCTLIINKPKQIKIHILKNRVPARQRFKQHLYSNKKAIMNLYIVSI